MAQEKPPAHFISEFSSNLPDYMAYIATDGDGVTALYVGGPGRNTPTKMEGSEALAPLGPRGELPFCWTPDGAEVTYLTRDAGGMTVQVADRDSGQARGLVSWKGTWFGPKWSPSGAHLAICGAGAEGAVCRVVSADGADETEIPGAQSAIWSPNGEEVAGLTPVGVVIHAVRNGDSSTIPGSEGRTGRVMWSHDGQLVAFEGVRPDGAKGVLIARPSAGTSAAVGPDLVDLKLIAMHPGRDELLAAGVGADGGRRLYRFAAPWRDGEDLTARIEPTFVMPSDVEDLTDLAGYTPNGDEVLAVASAPDSRLTRYLYAIPGAGGGAMPERAGRRAGLRLRAVGRGPDALHRSPRVDGPLVAGHVPVLAVSGQVRPACAEHPGVRLGPERRRRGLHQPRVVHQGAGAGRHDASGWRTHLGDELDRRRAVAPPLGRMHLSERVTHSWSGAGSCGGRSRRTVARLARSRSRSSASISAGVNPARLRTRRRSRRRRRAWLNCASASRPPRSPSASDGAAASAARRRRVEGPIAQTGASLS